MLFDLVNFKIYQSKIMFMLMLFVVIICKVFIMFNIQLQGCDGKKFSDKFDDKKCFLDKIFKIWVKFVNKS